MSQIDIRRIDASKVKAIAVSKTGNREKAAVFCKRKIAECTCTLPPHTQRCAERTDRRVVIDFVVIIDTEVQAIRQGGV